MRAPKYARTTANAGLIDTLTRSPVVSTCVPVKSSTSSAPGALAADTSDAINRRLGGNGITIGKTTMIIEAQVSSGARPTISMAAC